ncbi:uncharacterized protein LOC132610676 isoform X3 [Lycium barbarum]|uniref:uncharacterized protein LOC132610676 isoform X3 n=1 Tax=Lycium barbarum TaxID=112863 RepID=UPI00293E2CF4|nr:uncharacterized protein LOC132610676 isoform X3 [Lycium barbarum]
MSRKVLESESCSRWEKRDTTSTLRGDKWIRKATEVAVCCTSTFHGWDFLLKQCQFISFISYHTSMVNIFVKYWVAL